MKKFIVTLVLAAAVGCSNNGMSHTETAQVVAESFVQKDNEMLEKYTTPQRYQSLLSVQDIVVSSYSGDTNFEMVQDTVYGDTAWVQLRTAHEPEPETFKLIRQDGQWKVTETGLRERNPF